MYKLINNAGFLQYNNVIYQFHVIDKIFTVQRFLN